MIGASNPRRTTAATSSTPATIVRTAHSRPSPSPPATSTPSPSPPGWLPRTPPPASLRPAPRSSGYGAMAPWSVPRSTTSVRSRGGGKARGASTTAPTAAAVARRAKRPEFDTTVHDLGALRLSPMEQRLKRENWVRYSLAHRPGRDGGGDSDGARSANGSLGDEGSDAGDVPAAATRSGIMRGRARARSASPQRLSAKYGRTRFDEDNAAEPKTPSAQPPAHHVDFDEELSRWAAKAGKAGGGHGRRAGAASAATIGRSGGRGEPARQRSGRASGTVSSSSTTPPSSLPAAAQLQKLAPSLRELAVNASLLGEVMGSTGPIDDDDEDDAGEGSLADGRGTLERAVAAIDEVNHLLVTATEFVARALSRSDALAESVAVLTRRAEAAERRAEGGEKRLAELWRQLQRLQDELDDAKERHATDVKAVLLAEDKKRREALAAGFERTVKQALNVA
ncbi:hypothetical protein DFJ73DRAFT_924548 [Zopfochytrium polystomum]|nr:hypothetical protein DFJ73DRAFT_924548 [Zopfochytrium polystomum]